MLHNDVNANSITARTIFAANTGCMSNNMSSTLGMTKAPSDLSSVVCGNSSAHWTGDTVNTTTPYPKHFS